MDLVKMDVEGFEVRVLLGLRQRIRQDRPVIMMEFSPETEEEAGTEEKFRECIYEDAWIFSVGSISITSSYRLKPFSFATVDEILIVPAEKLEQLAEVIR